MAIVVLGHRFLPEKELGQRVGPQSFRLRVALQVDMPRNFLAKQLVTIDESLFKIQTGWQCMVPGPIEQNLLM